MHRAAVDAILRKFAVDWPEDEDETAAAKRVADELKARAAA